jgi:hypothetical protein
VTAPTRPEPVLCFGAIVAHWQQITAAVVTAAYVIGGGVIGIGWATQGQVNNVAGLIGGILGGAGTVLAVVMPLIGARTAKAEAARVREQVTPLESPQNSDGHPLVDSTWHGRHEAPDLA